MDFCLWITLSIRILRALGSQEVNLDGEVDLPGHWWMRLRSSSESSGNGICSPSDCRYAWLEDWVFIISISGLQMVGVYLLFSFVHSRKRASGSGETLSCAGSALTCTVPWQGLWALWRQVASATAPCGRVASNKFVTLGTLIEI